MEDSLVGYTSLLISSYVRIPVYTPVFDSYTQIKTAQSIDTTGVALF